MKKFALFQLSVLALLLNSAAQAETRIFMTGNTLNSFCNPRVTDACIAYISGVSDSVSENLALFPTHKICPPATSTPEQAAMITARWLQSHPEALHYSASGLVQVALSEAFTCKK